eukprot:4659825-Alexandrium_andersonii.AAC.1
MSSTQATLWLQATPWLSLNGARHLISMRPRPQKACVASRPFLGLGIGASTVLWGFGVGRRSAGGVECRRPSRPHWGN